MTVWIDFQAPPDVQLFQPFVKEIFNENCFCTARDYAETIHLLKYFNINFKKIGQYDSKKQLKKGTNIFKRTLKLYRCLSDKQINLSLTLGNLHTIYVSKMMDILCVNFMDNELGLKYVDTKRNIYEKLVVSSQIYGSDYIIIPSSFPETALIKEGFKKKSIYNYDGYKEEIYISGFSPDPNFLKSLPYKKYLVIRPESDAVYKKGKKSLVPKLVNRLIKKDYNLVFLPRNKKDLKLVSDFLKNKRLYIPSEGLNGLDLCYFSQGVLTGSGTMGREAALMGIPAVSFFPNDNLLSVDKSLIKKDLLFHSREVDKIINYLGQKSKNTTRKEKCKEVKKEVYRILKTIIKNK